MSNVLVNERNVVPLDDDPYSVLADTSALTGESILQAANAREAKFGTAPFDPAGDLIRFYPGGVTIWSGFPGVGKTSLIRQFVCHTLARGSSIFLASLEEDPIDVMKRMARTAAGGEPNAHQVQWFLDAYGERFRLWGQLGIARHRRILGVARTLAVLDTRHVVIDSLMCLDVGNDDYEAQRQFANLLSATAKVSNLHVHLVAHPRKLQSSNQELDLNDVAGARELGGIADNVIFVRRDPNRQSYGNNADVTPMCVSIRKQRHHHGFLGDVEGWFHRRFFQFSLNQFADAPVRYLPDDAFRSVREFQ